jgi:rhamnosyltransferase
MKLSVIIPVKNPGALFHQVLSAVLAQDTDFNFEVLVIDSGSTDGTIAHVRGLTNPRLRNQVIMVMEKHAT